MTQSTDTDVSKDALQGCARSRRGRISFSSRVIPGLVVGLDSIAVLSSAIGSYSWLVDYFDDVNFYAAASAFVWLASMLLMNLAGLYRLEAIMRPLAHADKIVVAFATTLLFLLAAAFALKISSTFSRIWVASFLVGACGGTIMVRLLASTIVSWLAARRVFTRNVVIVGGGAQADKLLDHIGRAKPRFLSIVGIFTEAVPNQIGTSRVPILGTLERVIDYVRKERVDDVVIALPWSADEQIIMLMGKLRELPVNAYLSSDLIGFSLPFRPPPDHFAELPLVEVMGRPLEGWGGLHKAVLDYSLALLLGVLLFPAMLIIALAIVLDSRGPVLFPQQRYGFVNRVFRIWKFRTMTTESSNESRTIQAKRNDPRVTRIGRFLRRTSLDELPQLFNVLNGTMSLVGPRPHAIDHNEEYAQTIRGYFARHRVKPGMTGWAQVNGLRGEVKTHEQMEARVKFDVYYAENWSVLFDLRILLLTAIVVVTGKNAY